MAKIAKMRGKSRGCFKKKQSKSSILQKQASYVCRPEIQVARDCLPLRLIFES